MTFLMRPIDDEDDIEWKNVLKDYRKTRSERDQARAELDSHIAFSGYIMEGIPEEEAEQKVNEMSNPINHSITVRFLVRNILNIVLFLSYLRISEAFFQTGLTWKIL